MINKTEQEIMEKWEGMQPIVSITCVTFNHEDYISETLDSFLMQETRFPFEVLIHDDASTDGTGEILREYEKQFPNIVKPVYQRENQFSQGINTMAILFPYVSGKYVAFCDGDDYWTDKEKLQIQVDAMEAHPEVDLCIHPSYQVIDGVRTEVLAKHANCDRIFSPKHSILGHGDFAETASMMFTASLIKSLPDWFNTAIPGDYVSEIMGSVRGGSLYINRIMAVYRTGLAGGWTDNELRKSTAERRETLINVSNQLVFLDNYLDRKFHHEFKQVIHNDHFDFIKMVSNDIAIKKEIYEQNQGDFSLFEKLQWHLLFKHQKLMQWLKISKQRIQFLKQFTLVTS